MKQLRFSPVQFASLGLIFLVWYVASLFFPPAFFPRPVEVLQLTYQNFLPATRFTICFSRCNELLWGFCWPS